MKQLLSSLTQEQINFYYEKGYLIVNDVLTEEDKAILEKWHWKMIDIFPDVSNGSELVGIYTKDKKSIFFDKNKKIGEESDPDFGKWFFAIWLSEKNLYPKLNKQLFGTK